MINIRDDSGVILDELAQMPGKALLDAERLAGALSVTARTVRRMVRRFELPPPIRMNGKGFWQVERVLQHIETRADAAEKEAERRYRKIQQYLP